MTTDETSYTAGERDDMFYFETLTFWVEGTLFKIPRLYFERVSGVFGDMLSLSSGSDNQEKEGSSDQNPIRLEAIKKMEFRRLLWVMFPDLNRFSKTRIMMNREQWTSVLKLSTLWSMGELRQQAIDALSLLYMNPIDKVLLAREYKVKKCKRLGWETAYAILKAREETYKQGSPPQPRAAPEPPYLCKRCGAHHRCITDTSKTSYCPHCCTSHCGSYESGPVQPPPVQRRFDNLDSSIRDAFQEELKDVEYGEDAIMAAALEVLPDMAEKLVERRLIMSGSRGRGKRGRGRGVTMG